MPATRVIERVPSQDLRRCAPIPLFFLSAFLSAQGMPYATLIGGDDRDSAAAVAVDSAGLITVVGSTASANWPYATKTTTDRDGFVLRLDPSRPGLAGRVWCTLLAGDGYDNVIAIRQSPAGDSVTVVGMTRSGNLRVTPSAYQPALRGAADAYVLQLDGSGDVTYLSYLGGDGEDWAHSVAVDAAGRIVVAGTTNSPSFPTTPGAFQSAFGGVQDTFVAILDPTRAGTAQLVAATFFGGSLQEGAPYDPAPITLYQAAGGLALAGDGSIVVADRTVSVDLPRTANAYQYWNAGGADIYVARLGADLDVLQYGTFLGGTGLDAQLGLAVRGTDVCVVGFTDSLGSTYPTTSTAMQGTKSGSSDAVLTLLTTPSTGPASLLYSTLLGSNGVDCLMAAVVEDSGVVTAVGATQALLGTPGAYLGVPSPEDTMIVRIDPQGVGMAGRHYLSFLSSGNPPQRFERPLGLALHGDGLLTIAGFIEPAAATFPPTANALQPISGGGAAEAYVVQFDPLPMGARRHGASTPACRGPIWLQVNENPAAGNTSFTVLGNGAPRDAVGALAIGAGMPSPVPFLGADLWVAPSVALPALADAQGAWRQPLPLPGFLPPPPSVFVQWVWLNGPSCAGGPLSASHALGL